MLKDCRKVFLSVENAIISSLDKRIFQGAVFNVQMHGMQEDNDQIGGQNPLQLLRTAGIYSGTPRSCEKSIGAMILTNINIHQSQTGGILNSRIA